MSDHEASSLHNEASRRANEIGKAALLEVRQAEREGCFSLALRDMVHKAEFHKMLRPRRYGGYAIGPHTFGEIVRTVARYNASAAWLIYFTILHEQWVAYLEPEGRQEIYDSDGFTADIFFPVGKVEYVEGGVKLSGTWNFGSGVLWDEWIGLGSIVDVANDDGGTQAHAAPAARASRQRACSSPGAACFRSTTSNRRICLWAVRVTNINA